MTCVEYEGGLTVTYSRAVEVKREPDDRERWCFKCRRRAVHAWVLYAEPFPSYYDPHWSLECPTCKGDYTHFPGCGPL